MIQLDIKQDIKKIEKSLYKLNKNIPKATSRALNKAIVKVKTEAKRDLSQRMGIAAKKVSQSFRVIKANVSNLKAYINARGAHIQLIYFKRTRQLKKGVKSQAWGKDKLYRGTFIAKMNSGHKGVFTRLFRKSIAGEPINLPIKELYGPSVPKEMNEKIVIKKMRTVGRITFWNEFKRQLRRVL